MAEGDLFFLVVVGPEKDILNVMAKKSKEEYVSKDQLKQVVELLKLVLTLDDEEIMKSTVESVIELLEEENSK